MEQQNAIPTHLGIILDGNRRWAKSHNLPSLEGHRIGYQNLKGITQYAFDKGIKYVSAYIFSIENWSRTKEEVKYLMGLILNVLTKEVIELNKSDIRVVCLGSRNRLSSRILKAIDSAEEKTRNNSSGTLCLCFNYGGYQEIVDAVKNVIKSGATEDQIDYQTIEESLYVPEVPAVDLIIRTSGEHRTSGFMLYRAAYSELYFTNKHWPEFNKQDLDDALDNFAKRQRRFGK